MKHFISALGHAHLQSMNCIFQYRRARVFLCNVGEVYIFEHGLYISALEHARMLILSNYVLLASNNNNYYYYYHFI